MRRIGKFYVAREIAMSDAAIEIFTKLQFVPYRVELMAIDDHFEYIGISPLFKQIQNGLCPPEYRIEISENEDGSGLSVAAIN